VKGRRLHTTVGSFGKALVTECIHTAAQVPRVKGERVQWVRTLGLEGLLARHLPLGNFADQLSGIKNMAEEELSVAVHRFIWYFNYHKLCRPMIIASDLFISISLFQAFMQLSQFKICRREMAPVLPIRPAVGSRMHLHVLIDPQRF
jgi:hypothetical protein